MRAVHALAVAATALTIITAAAPAQATVSPRPAARSVSAVVSSPFQISGTVSTAAPNLAAVKHRAMWRTQASNAFRKAEQVIPTHGSTPFVDASLARTAANLWGWKYWRTQGYLKKVLAAQHADGGWGTGSPMDSFQDGTVNPAGTTYTVTTADHVGPLLVDAYRAGAVNRSVLDRARASIMGTTMIATRDGMCISYSRSPYDALPAKPCVNNVNAAAGWFLRANIELGLLDNVPAEKARVATVADELMRHDTARLNAKYNRWPYSDATPTKMQDLDHNSLNVESHILHEGGVARSTLGRSAMWTALAAPLTTDYTDRLAWLRLGTFDPARSYQWVPYAQWMLDHTPTRSTKPGWSPRETTIRYAQVAVYSSRNMLNAR